MSMKSLFRWLPAAVLLAATATPSLAQQPAPAPAGVELGWLSSGTPLPQGVLPIIGGAEPGRQLPICRASFQNGVHPGKVVAGNCNIGYGGKEIVLNQFQLLVGRAAPTAPAIAWVPFTGQVPANAYIGGQEPDRTLPVCRAAHQNGVHPGKIVAGRCNIGWGGAEVVLAQFEVMTLVPPVAQASPPPAGSYRQTCASVAMNGPNLTAMCRTIAGQMVPATLNVAAAPAGQDIANCDGKLTIGGCQPPPVTNGVRIVRADYGLNCRAPRSDVSLHAALACNGKGSCSYKVDHTQIGDTAPNCAKDYQVAYECVVSNQAVSGGKGALGSEASGKTVELTCATAAPVTAGIKVTAAEYGTNCRAPAFYADVTQHIAAACNGKDMCAYKVDHNVIGDSAVGCAKEYKVSYECVGKGVVGTAMVASEASGRAIGLACPN
jgi:hypothetical protein